MTNPGGLPDIPDERDFRYEDVLGTGARSFDWKAGYDIEVAINSQLPVDDQNGSTSCGGQAFAKYDAVLEAATTWSFEKSSPLYIYNQTAVVINGVPQGSRLRDNADLVVKQGVALESLCPSYDHGKPPTDAFMLRKGAITTAAADSAKLRKGLSYAYVGVNIDLFAQAIRDNRGLVFLVAGQDNGTWYSPFPKPPQYRQWGHFMYAGRAKLIDGKKYIGALQSWGPNAGDNGWQWFGEEWFNGLGIESAVTIVFPDAPVPAKYTFTRDLTVGSTGIDVKYLQAYLNTHGFPVALLGPGSAGKETTYFGSLTKTALAKFQAANGIKPSVGYFGSITRAVVNQ
jgi:hypothetical protein